MEFTEVMEGMHDTPALEIGLPLLEIGLRIGVNFVIILVFEETEPIRKEIVSLVNHF